jgi:hypothetical protein
LRIEKPDLTLYDNISLDKSITPISRDKQYVKLSKYFLFLDNQNKSFSSSKLFIISEAAACKGHFLFKQEAVGVVL